MILVRFLSMYEMRATKKKNTRDNNCGGVALWECVVLRTGEGDWDAIFCEGGGCGEGASG